jgi:carbamoyl-phosphate synthase small subunit
MPSSPTPPTAILTIAAMQAELASFAGLEGADLAAEVSSQQSYDWQQGRWQWEDGFDDIASDVHVVALDFGIKTQYFALLV